MRFFPTTYLLVALAVIPLKTLAADENDAELIRSMQRQQHIDGDLCKKALPPTAGTQTQVFGCFRP